MRCWFINFLDSTWRVWLWDQSPPRAPGEFLVDSGCALCAVTRKAGRFDRGERRYSSERLIRSHTGAKCTRLFATFATTNSVGCGRYSVNNQPRRSTRRDVVQPSETIRVSASNVSCPFTFRLVPIVLPSLCPRPRTHILWKKLTSPRESVPSPRFLAPRVDEEEITRESSLTKSWGSLIIDQTLFLELEGIANRTTTGDHRTV